MSSALLKMLLHDDATLIGPTVEQWRALAPEERELLLSKILAVLEERAELAPVGRPRVRARSGLLDRLGQHFAQLGRRIYIADEMAVLYPGEKVFVPD